ncbi:MAG: ATP-binding protein [Gammaproteobacteria bacterium]|nr:ATP-binding protein [Gammaproteobacteria bacterium]MCF6259417.1 ATP-binding protein [Gammaproteobacteria bacterium]
MLSLNLRVLIAASAILSSFFGLAGVTLDQNYRNSVEQALEEQLLGSVYALIAVAGLDENGRLTMPLSVPDRRFSNPNSGLYAQVTSNNKNWLWRSESMEGMELPFERGLSRTKRLGKKVIQPSGRELYLLSYGVVWSDVVDPQLAYTFSIAQDMAGLNAGIAGFRRSLWGSLGGVALLLLAVQGAILRWGLSPLKKATDELAAIEAGRQVRLQGGYPPELQGLTGNINTLLSQQQEHLDRYRRTLGDLAHSLKTPLAILQSAAENKNEQSLLPQVVQEQVEHMNQITGYQLQRAATSGWTALTAPVKVRKVVCKVISGLNKVYADKKVDAIFDVDASVEFHGDEGDLLEIVGNLTDNAYKWCDRQVRVAAQSRPGPKEDQWDILLRVDDDGVGVAPEMVQYVMQRGRRADNDIAGHGIGLSIVRDIVQVYGGTLEITGSELGGAAVNIWLPMRSADTEKQ